eukprot:329854_1
MNKYQWMHLLVLINMVLLGLIIQCFLMNIAHQGYSFPLEVKLIRQSKDLNLNIKALLNGVCNIKQMQLLYIYISILIKNQPSKHSYLSMLIFNIYIILILFANAFIPHQHLNKSRLTVSDLAPSRHYSVTHRYLHSSLHSSGSSCKLSLYSNNSSPILYPTDYGADPYGLQDSTNAFNKIISIMLTRGNPTAILSNKIHDCGGVTIDLQGGDYLISHPLQIPSFYGNFRFIDGTIRAANNFAPQIGYLLTVGNVSYDCNNSQGSCNENIAFENMMFDCRKICDGGLRIQDTMGSVIGPQVFFLGYKNSGITVFGGHETQIMNSWFGNCLYSDPDPECESTNATAIQLNDAPDMYVIDIIVFRARIGISINGGANYLNGVHVWGALGPNSAAIAIQGPGSVRCSGCYMDYNSLLLKAPIDGVIIEDSYFIHSGLVLATTKQSTNITGMVFKDSIYEWGNGAIHTITLDETYGKFSKIQNVYVDGMMVKIYNSQGYIKKYTKVMKSLSLKNSTLWTFDFNDVLLFDTHTIPIQSIEYTFQMDSLPENNQFVQHMVTKGQSGKVSVITNIVCDATVYMTVDQSEYTD